MPKKPSSTLPLPTLDDFGVPSSTELQQAGVVGRAISKVIAEEDAITSFHHKMVRHGIAGRFGLALAIASNKKAYANFAKEPRIKALPRPPKDASDTLQALFHATYPDPKKASKYYKRVEPMWIKRCSADEVLAFLAENGLSKSSSKASPDPQKPGSGMTASDSAKPKKTSEASVAGNGDRGAAPATNQGDTPCGTFYFWPGKITVGRCYDLHVKILEDDGEVTIFDLHDVSPSSVQ